MQDGRSRLHQACRAVISADIGEMGRAVPGKMARVCHGSSEHKADPPSSVGQRVRMQNPFSKNLKRQNDVRKIYREVN